MFKQKKRREPAITTLVGATTRVQGDIEFVGGCLVDGHVEGNVRADGDDEATLSVSERGCIEGAVVVPSVLLNGTVKGDVEAKLRIVLGSKARVVGNVRYSLIEMAIGAEVNGKLIHASETGKDEAAANEAARHDAMAHEATRHEATRHEAPRHEAGTHEPAPLKPFPRANVAGE